MMNKKHKYVGPDIILVPTTSKLTRAEFKQMLEDEPKVQKWDLKALKKLLKKI